MPSEPAPHVGSYYAATARDSAGFPALSGDTQAEVAVIGGGFTGVATALALAARGVDVALVEAHRIGWGASGRNGGQVTGSLSGEGAMLRRFRRALGASAAADYVWDLRWRGHRIIKDTVARHAIACDLTHGHVLAAWRAGHIPGLRRLAQAHRARGAGDDVRLLEGPALAEVLGSRRFVAGLVNRRSFHLHALDLVTGEARAAEGLGARILEATPVTALRTGPDEVVLETPMGRLRARAAVLAGNAYHRLGGWRLQAGLYPAGLGQVATAPLEPALADRLLPGRHAVYDTRFVLDYFRLTADRRLIFGGGINYSGRLPADIAGELRPALEATFPELAGVRIDHAWHCTAGITPSRIPMLGRLLPNLYYAQGYSGHGIAFSHIAAGILADAIGGDTRELDLFAAARGPALPVPRVVGQAVLTATGVIARRLQG